ncbi:hypothetical protein KXD93_28840 [Mucilaginibacter sp. BJC16-A38]|uniref:hypothetical protein n=1 Tax=Mucilaginibacter phenanthrenivorans TaxID=1234842 RepID=UPI0021588C94|nr:hypothetical protein [Mucilaginibacter phenanthrenivorans]MCR8561697.1 hypothetical protein [Mucilaginibacter phenanthrenivorans]
MKYLKVLLIAVVTVITFGSAKAQVVVKARVGGLVHRHYVHHRRVVVRPVHHRHWRHHRRYHRRY